METSLKFRLHLAAAAAALFLVACGGGSDPAITSVKVMGDSLADSGTFGLKFTVQAAAPTGAGSTPIWPELVASGVGANSLCAFYRFTGTSFNTSPGCTNYAIGGGRINNASNAQDPRSIPLQLQQAAQVHGSYKSTDLLLVDGGGNDAADLAGAYLGATSEAGLLAYRNLLTTVLTAVQVDILFGQANGAALAGGAYMEGLADRFYTSLKEQALDKGATKLVVLNMPDITLTPRFRAVLAGITQAAGATQAQQAQALFRQWIAAFNTKLASRVAGNEKIALIDFNGLLSNQVVDPLRFGFTNVTGTACPVVGVGSDGLPAYDFPTCTTANLAANPPAGEVGVNNWWTTYLFSDGFHPTARGHEQLAIQVSKAVREKRWD